MLKVAAVAWRFSQADAAAVTPEIVEEAAGDASLSMEVEDGKP